MKKRKRKTKVDFSKKMIIVLTVYNVMMTVWAFILYSIGMDVPEAIVIALISGLFGEFSGYLTRAYLGKRNEEANKLKLAEMDDTNGSKTDSLEEE